MAVEASLPHLGIVIITALVDSINPCAIGVLILLISTLIVIGHSKTKMLKVGLIYISAVYLTYLAAGIGLTAFFNIIPLSIAQYISMTVAAIVVLGGLIEIKDFFWYGKGISLKIAPRYVKYIEKRSKNLTTWGAVVLGAFVAAVELPCTGGPYLAITLILSQSFNIYAVYLLLLYNVIFVLPLIVILLLIYFGTRIQIIKKWKQNSRAWMRLAIGIILIILGWLLILIANGTINLN